jgi:hypothetical protein
MLKTGELCIESGFYRCNVHVENLIFIEKGYKVPECSLGPYGPHTTLWGPARKVSHIVSELKARQMHPAESSR